MNWREAVWHAVQREAARTGGAVTRQGLIDHQLAQIVDATQSGGRTPEQTMSRELQGLRDAGAIIFDGIGTYRISPVSAKALTADDAVVTEREALRLARVGQGRFRDGLMARFGGRCPMTVISDAKVLVASHIVPWARCRSSAERLDPENGLLLSALWDAAFDAGRVSFSGEGTALVARDADEGLVRQLLAASETALPERVLTDAVRGRLAEHRAAIGDTGLVRLGA